MEVTYAGVSGIQLVWQGEEPEWWGQHQVDVVSCEGSTRNIVTSRSRGPQKLSCVAMVPNGGYAQFHDAQGTKHTLDGFNVVMTFAGQPFKKGSVYQVPVEFIKV
jgi:hypothetical protein